MLKKSAKHSESTMLASTSYKIKELQVLCFLAIFFFLSCNSKVAFLGFCSSRREKFVLTHIDQFVCDWNGKRV